MNKTARSSFSNIDGSNNSPTHQRHLKVSSLCGGGECVAVAKLANGNIAIHDKKDLSHKPMVFTHAEWKAFVAGVKNGEFDIEALKA